MCGHMIKEHQIDVHILDEMRCCHGTINDGLPVMLTRVFSPGAAACKGIRVTGWETLDEHPELILYE
jgi:hypothetical protein